MAAGMNSKIFRAKNELNVGSYNETKETVHKGQLFYVDELFDLPGFDEKNYKNDWEELHLFNNFSQIQLRTKE